jgi:hypothetical protein
MLLARAPVAHAHERDFQKLQLTWDASDNTLRGQLTGASPELVEENLDIELDAISCPLELRPLDNDSVALECPLQHPPQQLRIFAGSGLHGVILSLQREEPSGEVQSDRILVLAGTWSATYELNAPPRAPTSERLSTWTTATRYLRYGIDHILDDGWDHVAFVATLVLGATHRGFLALLLRLSAFTLAHSITLALGALGVIMLPQRVVEPLIALSIALLALMQLLRSERDRAQLSRYDLLVPFAFGLLHGQGFASVLIDAGLPVAGLVIALLAFNLGVELGQALWASLFWLGLRALPRKFAPRVVWLCALGLAALGLFWTWERTLG